jgi:hypothetical protein
MAQSAGLDLDQYLAWFRLRNRDLTNLQPGTQLRHNCGLHRRLQRIAAPLDGEFLNSVKRRLSGADRYVRHGWQGLKSRNARLGQRRVKALLGTVSFDRPVESVGKQLRWP